MWTPRQQAPQQHDCHFVVTGSAVMRELRPRYGERSAVHAKGVVCHVGRNDVVRPPSPRYFYVKVQLCNGQLLPRGVATHDFEKQRLSTNVIFALELQSTMWHSLHRHPMRTARQLAPQQHDCHFVVTGRHAIGALGPWHRERSVIPAKAVVCHIGRSIYDVTRAPRLQHLHVKLQPTAHQRLPTGIIRHNSEKRWFPTNRTFAMELQSAVWHINLKEGVRSIRQHGLHQLKQRRSCVDGFDPGLGFRHNVK
mmetsp:Transcript_42634/g.72002  ORF Transcript_42634/g.72002 Transcript_42634/m.72002 type:complete len:252 (-) Transcript_42634:194-949(-)